MSQNDGWAERWSELVDDLERQRQALQFEQERWAEWHAVQEEALLEQVRLLEEREKDVTAREHLLAETLRALEEDAILLDEKHQLLRRERRLFQEEVADHNNRLQQVKYRQNSLRAPPVKQRRNRYHHHAPPDDVEDEYSEIQFSQMSEEDEVEDVGSVYKKPQPRGVIYNMRERSNQHTHVPRSKVTHRQITSPLRDCRDYSYPRTPPSAPPMSDAMGAFEVRVNSPDNTRVQVTYRDQPQNLDARRLYNPRNEEAIVERAQLQRSVELEKWQSLPPPPRIIEQRGAELTTGNSGGGIKVSAGIQASEHIRSKVKVLRESMVPSCGAISDHSSSSGHNGINVESDVGTADRPPAVRIADIVRTAKPPSSTSNLSQAPSGNRMPQNSRSSSIEYKLSKRRTLSPCSASLPENLVDKLDR